MSRPQKIIPPVKGTFTSIINAVADGKGVAKPHPKEPGKDMANERNSEKSSNPPPPKKP